MKPVVTIYTDGAASGNPGPGGYGVVLMSGRHYKELSGGFSHTTNNRMELMAVIVALETLKIEGSEVTIYTDSRYVADAVNQKWVFSWRAKYFKGKKNQDLWMRFLRIYEKHDIKIEWIKGHNENKYNELCDKLAVAAAAKPGLPEDTGYLPE